MQKNKYEKKRKAFHFTKNAAQKFFSMSKKLRGTHSRQQDQHPFYTCPFPGCNATSPKLFNMQVYEVFFL